MRWKLSSSHSPAGVIRSFADTAAVNCSQTSISTVSFAANRERSRSRARRGVNRCAAARILPWRSICSALNNSERSGSSSTGALYDKPPMRKRALNCVRCPRIDVLLVTESRCPFVIVALSRSRLGSRSDLFPFRFRDPVSANGCGRAV